MQALLSNTLGSRVLTSRITYPNTTFSGCSIVSLSSLKDLRKSASLFFCLLPIIHHSPADLFAADVSRSSSPTGGRLIAIARDTAGQMLWLSTLLAKETGIRHV